MPTSNGQWTDLITDFMAFTEGTFTSEIHRRWSAISLIGGAMERRVWSKTGRWVNFPNLYILLVAPPGRGKGVIETIRELWQDTKKPNSEDPAFHVAPDSMTRAALIDVLSESKTTYLPPDGPIQTYHHLQIPAEEFEVLMHKYDPEFISFLNSIWNNKPFHAERRRYGTAQRVSIINPILNILGGVTPAYFTAHFPEEAWNTGLVRRIIMVYSGEKVIQDIFYEKPNLVELREKILHRLSLISTLWGVALWDRESSEYLSDWHLSGGAPAPTHSRLLDYNQSRTQTLIRLCLISAVSREGTQTIRAIDFTRAKMWLEEVESLMPSIFRAMQGKSNAQVIEELYYFARNQYTIKKEPIHISRLQNFLSTRVEMEKIDLTLKTARRMNVFVTFGGNEDLWIPVPQWMHGVE